MKKLRYFLLLPAIFLSGCGIFEKSAQVERKRLFDSSAKSTLFIASADATRRYNVIFYDENCKCIKTVSENPPDVSVNKMLEIVAKVNGNLGAKISVVQSIAELGKRNAANYLVRDIAFRVESLYNNSSRNNSNNNNVDTLIRNNYGGWEMGKLLEFYKYLLATAEKISINESKGDRMRYASHFSASMERLIIMAKDPKNKDIKIDSLLNYIGEELAKE